mgnify:CR=1 FL=1
MTKFLTGLRAGTTPSPQKLKKIVNRQIIRFPHKENLVRSLNLANSSRISCLFQIFGPFGGENDPPPPEKVVRVPTLVIPGFRVSGVSENNIFWVSHEENYIFLNLFLTHTNTFIANGNGFCFFI